MPDTMPDTISDSLPDPGFHPVFREISDGDVPVVIDLWARAGLTRPWNDPARDIAFARESDNAAVLLGKVGDAPVATVMAGHDGHRGTVYYLGVEPASQGNGYGRAAMAAAEAWLAARGVWKINLLVRGENRQAIGFYEKLGYRIEPNAQLGKRLSDPAGKPAEPAPALTGARAIADALAFAARAHVDQRRKGTRAEPYVNHLAEVADLVAEETQGRDTALIIAALLHDTVEDTPVTLADIMDRFGADVAGLVADMTDDKSLPKGRRKLAQIEHAADLAKRAKVLKIADKVSNMRSILTSAPADWPAGRIRAYAIWGRAVVDGCRGAAPDLEAAFDEAAAAILEKWPEPEDGDNMAYAWKGAKD